MDEEVVRDERLDRVTVSTLLGIRFVDLAKGTQVPDGLAVTARAEGRRGPVTQAFRTASNLFAFRGLDGLRAVEHAPFDPADGSGSTFILEVVDHEGRFAATTILTELPLPYRGVFLNGSPPLLSEMGVDESRVPGFLLLSAASRPTPPGLAAVRADLVEYPSRRPAAYALLEVHYGEAVWYGPADAAGRAAAFLPFPPVRDAEPQEGENGSSASSVDLPPEGTDIPLSEKVWELSFRIRYQPKSLKFPLGRKRAPELKSVFAQSYRSVWLSPPPPPSSPSASEGTALLKPFEEIVLRTGVESELWLVDEP